MRKKLSTRFPAARIKKIMQADEEVGKIAMATPVLISKALELFLQDLCDRTYEVTARRGAKTLSSPHLKHCVESNGVYDFLQHVVAKVPDIGCDTEEKNGGRRRKYSDGDGSEDEEAKRPKSESGRGRGGRGRGRGGRGRNGTSSSKIEIAGPIERLEIPTATNKAEDVDDMDHDASETESEDSPKLIAEQQRKRDCLVKPQDADAKSPRNFDLNMGLDENGDVPVATSGGSEVEADAPQSPQIPAHVEPFNLQPRQDRHEEEDDYDCEDDDDG